MRSYFQYFLNNILLLIPILILTGCVTNRQPIFKNSTFGQEKIETIYMLPVIDSRFSKEPELPDLNRDIFDKLKSELRSKKYRLSMLNNNAFIENITEEVLKKADANWIKNFAHPEARWIMVVFLVDTQSKITLGSSGSAVVSGYLFDKKNGSLLWRDKGFGKVSHYGLLNILTIGMVIGESINKATEDLTKSIPYNK